MRAEDAIQRTIVDFIRTVAPQVLVYAVPNASRRTESGKASNGVPGLLPGIPDIGIVIPGGRHAFIEVKTPKGVLSAPQKDIRDRLHAMEHPFAVCTGWEEVRDALALWGVPTREAKTTVTVMRLEG